MNTISEVRGAIEARKVSAREVAAEYFKRSAARNRELNAYLVLCEERAYRQADRVDELVATSSPWAVRMRTPRMVRCRIRWHRGACREDRAGDRPQWWRRIWRWRHSEQTQVDRFASQDRSAAYRQ